LKLERGLILFLNRLFVSQCPFPDAKQDVHFTMVLFYRYLGRKRSTNAKEPWAAGSDLIVHVDYSYWTLGYAITSRGVKKLIEAKPFEKLVPLDEFLPIMFDRHIK
jgi:hypothetical protein